LSLDWELTRIALQALEGYRGSIVVISLATGDILTAVSDQVTLEREGWAAFYQAREPASIMKLLTVTAAMRAGIGVDEKLAQMTCRGAERYQGGILYCTYRAGPLEGLNRAMAISCNIAFANLGILVGRRAMIEELRRYGFDRPDTEGFRYGEILNRSGNQLQLANLSIGLNETSLTPLHGALIAAAFGNDGILPEPRLLFASDGWLGLSPLELPLSEACKVIDSAWIPQMLAAMDAVVKRGTAYGISVPAFPVAMKTGTGRNRNMGFHTNYIGIGPMPDPVISFCIRVTNQPTSSRVRRATLRVARSLFESLSQKRYLLP
jgi:peptidoglycan glycosyltransferase